MFVEAGGCPKSKSIALSEYSSGLVIYLFLRKISKFQISYIMFLETHTCFYTSFGGAVLLFLTLLRNLGQACDTVFGITLISPSLK